MRKLRLGGQFLVICLALTFISPRLSQATPEVDLEQWRKEAFALRLLADNDAGKAYDLAKSLSDNIPPRATLADRTLILNRLTRAEVHLGKSDDAAGHAEAALQLTKRANDPVGLAEAYLNVAVIAVNRADIEAIVDAPTIALEALKAVDRPELLAEALLRQAMSLRQFGKIEESVAACLRAHEIASNTKSAMAMAYAHQCMAVTYEQSNRQREALEQYIRMRVEADDAGSRHLYAEAVFGMAMVELNLGDTKTAERYMIEATSIFRVVGIPFAEARVLKGRAELLRRQNRLVEAASQLDNVFRIFARYDNRIGMWQALISRGEVHQAQGNLYKSLEDGDLALARAGEIGLEPYTAKSAERLSSVHAALGDYQKAYEYAQRAASITDRLFKDTISADVIRLTDRYEGEIKQREIDRLDLLNQQHLHTQRWLWSTAAGGILLFFVTGHFLLQQRRSQRRLLALNKELGRSRTELRATLNAIPDLFFKVDLDGRYLDLRSSEEQLLLFPANELIGKTIAEVLPPEAADRCMQAIRETQVRGRSFGTQYSLVLPDGKRWFELSISRKQTTSEARPVFIAIARDITERKRMEAALEEGEARYRHYSNLLQSIFESAKTVSIYALDSDYRYLAFNGRHREAAKRKWRTDIAVGMRMLDVVDTDEHREFCRQGFDQVLAGRSFSLESKEPVVKDGVTVYEYNENHGSPIRKDNGEIIGLTIFAVNVTERKRLEVALQESEARYRHNSNLLQAIFESPISVSIYALDRNYRYLAFNGKFREAAKRLWSADIAVGMNMLDVIDTEAHREFSRRGFDRALAGRSDYLESKEAVVKDGRTEYEYHENYGSPIRDDNGEIIGLTVFAINITERKRVEQQLAAREREFRTLVENLPDTIYRYDRDCRRIFVSPAVERLSGVPIAQLIGKTPADGQLLVSEQSRKLMQTVRRTFETGETQQLDIEYTNTDGSRDYAFLMVPESNADGQVETVLSIGRDVTSIRSIERRIGRFMANAAAFAYSFRQSPDGQHSIPFASPGIETLFGIGPEDVRDDAAPLHSQIYLYDAVRFGKAIAESARSMTPFHQEFRVLRPNQPERWIESRAIPERAADGSVVWQGIMLDITERKHAEIALTRSEREFRTLVENIPDLVSRYDRDCRRVFVNSAVSRVFKKPADELVGRAPLDSPTYPRKLGQDIMQTIRQTFASGKPQQLDIEHDGRDYAMLAAPESNEDGEVETVLAISRDVTALRSVERSMARFMANAAAFVFTFRQSPEGFFCTPFSSPGITTLLGIQPEDVRYAIGPSDLQVFSEDDLARARSAIAESAKSMQPFHLEFLAHRGGAPDRWIECHSLPERDADGGIVWQGIMLDITERKEAETALVRRELEFRTLAENSPDNIVRYDREGRISYINPHFAEMTGTTLEEVSGKTLTELQPPEKLNPDYLEAIASVLRTGADRDIELTLDIPGTATTYHNIRLVAEHDEHGEISGVLAIGRDITERRRIEMALASSEREFRTLAEHSPDNIARYDRQGRVLYVNPQLAKQLGANAEDIIGKNVAELLSPGKPEPGYREAFDSVVATGLGREIELTQDIPGQKSRYFSIRFVAERDESGGISGVLAIGHDISEIKHNERKLEESRNMLRKLSDHRDSAREEERKHIAREIHDHLGQMLTAQRLDIATLKFQFAASNPSLNERCQHLLNVTDLTIQSVRDIATMLRPSSLDMGILSALGWLANDFHKRSGIVCDVVTDSQDLNLDEKLSLAVFRIVQESLTNVARHSGAKRVRVVLAHSDNHLRLSIQDNGKGFDPDALSRGSFGLLGIHERALMIGGDARIRSAPGEGTVVEIDIPLAPIEETEETEDGA